MKASLLTKQVGPYSMNTYVVIDEGTKNSAIIDPGGDPNEILNLTAGTQVSKILITHGHFDHVIALEDIKAATQSPVFIHPADADANNIKFDFPLAGDQILSVGNSNLRVIHTPGHTPGQCCFVLGNNRIVVGDTLFVGGPGRTASPEDFAQTMKTMVDIVFSWSDDVQFFPGHGPSGKIGIERPRFEDFLARGWSADTFGDVTW
jgi:glyoxylase-like metal-dependent hydrolase (beta-lactamase superfamily II)